MFKRKLTISDFLLIVVNLIPLYGVWFEGWDAKPIFLVYCLETVIIGIINVVKMACITIFVRKKDVWENGGSTTMQSGWFLLGDNGKLMLLIFVAYYTMQNVFGFFSSGVYKTISLGRQMFEPYMRIFVQQFVVILGSMFLNFGAGKIFILVFIIVKIFFELFVNFDRLLSIAEKRQRQKDQRDKKN